MSELPTSVTPQETFLEFEATGDKASSKPTKMTVRGIDKSLGVVASEETLAALASKVPDKTGTWGYYVGASGTVNVTGRVLQITAKAGLSTDSLTINGGPTITIPSGETVTIRPEGQLDSPTVVFSNTESYFIEVVS